MTTMTQEQIDLSERQHTGTSWTRNADFERDGYLIIKNLCDPESLKRGVPILRGQLNYFGSYDKYNYTEEEKQVNNSFATYSYPGYKHIHSEVRLKLESIIGRKLHNTYYYDRFYFNDQELVPHTDRPACEISVTVHIDTNMVEDWPIWIKTPDKLDPITKEIIEKGQNRAVNLQPGDGMVYKGCERPHWREKIPHIQDKPDCLITFDEMVWYHQVFFHYVLADGIRSHYAFDRCN